jgi:Tfp pilus assembly protein PilN
MINLLPPKEKKELLMERTKRMIIILWFLFLFFLTCFILILLSIKIYIQGQIDYNKTYLASTEQEFLKSERAEFMNKVISANLDLQKISSFYEKRIDFSDVLEKISTFLPADIYLNEISFRYIVEGEKENRKEKMTVVLSGFAPFTEDVTEFENNLKKEKQFEDINFPLSNWVEEKDINLYVTFSIAL